MPRVKINSIHTVKDREAAQRRQNRVCPRWAITREQSCEVVATADRMPSPMLDYRVNLEEPPERLDFTIDGSGASIGEAMTSTFASFLRSAVDVGLPGKPRGVFATDDLSLIETQLLVDDTVWQFSVASVPDVLAGALTTSEIFWRAERRTSVLHDETVLWALDVLLLLGLRHSEVHGSAPDFVFDDAYLGCSGISWPEPTRRSCCGSGRKRIRTRYADAKKYLCRVTPAPPFSLTMMATFQYIKAGQARVLK